MCAAPPARKTPLMPLTHRSRCIAAVLVGGAAAAAVDRLGRRSGVSREELAAALPGDDLVPQPRWSSTRAITVGRPPAQVWPWIAQMGFPTLRGGWYTPHWLDRAMWRIEARSSERIVPELQGVAVGDRIPDSPDWSAYFDVVAVERDRALVLLSTKHLLPPYRDLRFSWAFVLTPARGGNATRLTIRARTTFADVWPHLAVKAFVWALMGPVDWLNVRVMLRGIKRRAERTP